MARGRFIPKELATDLQINAVSAQAEFLYLRIVPHLDVEGRAPGHPKQVRAIAVPMRTDFTEAVIAKLLEELEAEGVIQWYEVEGTQYIADPRFDEFQMGLRKDREAGSRIPPPPNCDLHNSGSGELRTNSGELRVKCKGSEDQDEGVRSQGENDEGRVRDELGQGDGELPSRLTVETDDEIFW